MRHHRIAIAVFVVILGLFCCTGVGVLGLTTPYLGYLRTECAVGVVGASASITVRGPLAGRTCQALEDDGTGQFFGRSDTPTEPVICEYPRGRQRLIVRDTGTLKLVGNAICGQLRSGAMIATPSPAVATLAVPPTAAPTARAGWLDRRPLPAWNTAGAAVPRPSTPLQPRDSLCPPIPQGATPEDRLVAVAGWYIYTDDIILGDIAVVLAELGTDGMCRPIQFQAFVFVGGRFAGTLSPMTMDARMDGALGDVAIGADRVTLTAKYVRYDGTEPACCPSRISTATFALDRGVPLLQVRQITTAPTSAR